MGLTLTRMRQNHVPEGKAKGRRRRPHEGWQHIALTTVRNVLGEIETKEKFGKTPVELDDLQAAPRENGAEIRNKQLTIDSPRVFLIDPV